jgi:trans-aconitate methyltransferase
MQNYIWDAEDYENHSKSQQIWGQELISKLKLKHNDHVLDIGCGDGKLTVEIAKIVADGEVIGIDSSEEMINLAAKRYPPDSHPNLHFQILDARELNYDQQFDVVFSNAVLHWIHDHQSLLQNIYTCLKPGGRGLLQMGGKGNASEVLNILSTLTSKSPWKQYFENFEFPYSFYGPEEYDKWIGQVGFKKSRIELIPKDMTFDDQSELEGWIRTTWLPYLKTIPEDLRNNFISELCDRYLQSYPSDMKGMIQVKMVRLEVDLIKPYI